MFIQLKMIEEQNISGHDMSMYALTLLPTSRFQLGGNEMRSKR